MALRNMRYMGDDILRKRTRTVEVFDSRLWELLDDMRDTLKAQNGAGLAAPQIGVLKKVAIVSYDDVHIELVNPEIIYEEGEANDLEGCLSIPNKSGFVTRPTKVTVRAQDRDGAWFEIDEEGFTARALCHEIDHLNGILYADKVTEWLDNEKLEQMRAEAKSRRTSPKKVTLREVEK